jgi:hypothetical protein
VASVPTTTYRQPFRRWCQILDLSGGQNAIESHTSGGNDFHQKFRRRIVEVAGTAKGGGQAMPLSVDGCYLLTTCQ